VTESTSRSVHDLRWLELDGAYNVRDLGGLPTLDGRMVRTGRLFRGDSLDGCSARDVELLRDRVGIRRTIDMRHKIREHGPLGPSVARLPIPLGQQLQIFDAVVSDLSNNGVITLYLEYLTAARMQTSLIIRTIAAHCHEPLLFHCTSGKDRTGVVAALIQLLLGVAEELVVEDYALTDARMPPIVEGLRGTNYGVDLGHPEMFRARAGTMRSVLAELTARHGSADEWALDSGLTHDDLSRLREQLLIQA
jgi:protein tyrosine/serine phosphatase